jgi:hypothetical protein
MHKLIRQVQKAILGKCLFRKEHSVSYDRRLPVADTEILFGIQMFFGRGNPIDKRGCAGCGNQKKRGQNKPPK